MPIENATIFIQAAEPNYLVDIGVPLMVGFAAVFVSAVTLWYQRRTHRETAEAEKEKVRLAALAPVFRLLNDLKHSEARNVLYDIDTDSLSSSSFDIMGITEFDVNENRKVEDLKTTCKEIVRSDFNEIGTLIHYKLLDGKIIKNTTSRILLGYSKNLESLKD